MCLNRSWRGTQSSETTWPQRCERRDSKASPLIQPTTPGLPRELTHTTTAACVCCRKPRLVASRLLSKLSLKNWSHVRATTHAKRHRTLVQCGQVANGACVISQAT